MAPWPGFEPGSRYIILRNVGRATAAYTRPDYTTKAIKPRRQKNREEP